jgi:hypothetical protein
LTINLIQWDVCKHNAHADFQDLLDLKIDVIATRGIIGEILTPLTAVRSLILEEKKELKL